MYCRLLVLLAALLAIIGSEPIQAGSTQSATGQVDSLQLVDASEFGGDVFLILTFEDGRGFQLPGQRQLAAGQGTRVEIRYLVADEPDLLPEVCSVTVLAVPIEIDGTETLREAARPFEVYRNPGEACDG
jgi:hypothetical protein